MSTLSPHAPVHRAASRGRTRPRARAALLADELALGRPARARSSRGPRASGCALIAAAIVLYMGYRGIQYLRPGLIFSRPQASADQAGSGGFLDPLLGTIILTVIGIVLAMPLALCSAVWITEYGRPSWLARVVESSIEIVAGTPDIVIAIFGLAIFQLSLFAPFSFTAEGGGVYGNSFIAAGAMMSLLALPPIYTATRDGLQAVPGAHARGGIRAGQDAHHDDPACAAAERALEHRHRRHARHQPHHRLDRDRAAAARQHAADRNAGLVPGHQRAARHRLLTDQLRLRKLAGRRRGAPQKAYAAAFLLLIFVLR